MTVAFSKFNQFVQDMACKVHNLSADTLMVMLTNTAPSASNAIKSDITEISGGNGYTANGNSASITSCTQTSGVLKLILGNPATWTASGGTIGPFRYAVLYNATPTSPLKPLIGYYDYGSSITLAIGEQFQVAFDATNGVLTDA
jgi:hypothetical protein